MSPVESCGMLRVSTILGACEPLPQPGAPKRIITVLPPASAAASADTALVRPASQERAARSTVGWSSMRLPAPAMAPRETAVRSVFAEAPSGARNEPVTAPRQSSERPRMTKVRRGTRCGIGEMHHVICNSFKDPLFSGERRRGGPAQKRKAHRTSLCQLAPTRNEQHGSRELGPAPRPNTHTLRRR